MTTDPCFVVQLDKTLAEPLRQGLIAQGFTLSQPAHTLFQGKKPGITCTLYLSGKLMVQGKEKGPFIEFFLEPEILNTFTYSHGHLLVDQTPRIGVDESGKGDFFGPLCIAGVYAHTAHIARLVELGIKDSKLLADTSILKLAEKIKALCPTHVIALFPKKYNALYTQFRNLNTLLGWGHATVIDTLAEKTQCSVATIDQFAAEGVVLNALKRKGRTVQLTQRPRGEQDVVVAAASIMARAAFVLGLRHMQTQWNCTFSKGANAHVVAEGKKFVQEYGAAALEEVAKLHFKTTQLVIWSTTPP